MDSFDNEEEPNEQEAVFTLDLENITLEDIFFVHYEKKNKKYLKTMTDMKQDFTKNLASGIYYHAIGQRSFATGNYMQALYYLNGCLIYTPAQHEVYGLALENRSETFFRLEKYKECLSDIEIIPTTKCPKQLYYKIYIRKCCAFINLGEYTNAWKALGQVEDAVQYIDPRAIPDNPTDIEDKMNLLGVVIREHLAIEVNQVKVEKIQYELPSLLNGDNEKFFGASNSVKLMDNNRIGRYTVATESIAPKSVLFVEDPYATSYPIPLNHLTSFCCNCLATTAAFIPCHGCLDTFFCSLKCKDLYWNTRHRWECVGIRKKILSPIMSLALAMLFRASFTNFPRQTVADVFGNKSDNYAYVRTLITNEEKISPEKMKQYVKMSCWMVAYLKTYTNYFWWMQNTNSILWRSTTILHRTIGGLLLKHLFQIDFNAENIGECIPGSSTGFCQGISYQNKTLALYVSTRMIRHSCMPNAIVSFHGTTKIVQAIRNIEPGDEITVSYFNKKFVLDNYKLPIEHTKRINYLQRYLMQCHCAFCSCTDADMYSKLYSWKCVKCFNYATGDNTNIKAQCQTCQYEFDLNFHKLLEKSLEKKFDQIENKLDENYLKDIEFRMNNIYHCTNINFSYLYAYFVRNHEMEGEFAKAVNYVKQVANMRLLWFSYSDEIFASHMVFLTIINVKIYLSLKDMDVYCSDFEIRQREEIIYFLNLTLDCLQYHMSQESIDSFRKIVIDMLDSPTYIHSKQVENIIYYTCSKTPVLIQLSDNPNFISDDVPINEVNNLEIILSETDNSSEELYESSENSGSDYTDDDSGNVTEQTSETDNNTL